MKPPLAARSLESLATLACVPDGLRASCYRIADDLTDGHARIAAGLDLLAAQGVDISGPMGILESLG